jgi:ABC-type nitrate/sulfonate/bicarbonate transport system ATPase subunit
MKQRVGLARAFVARPSVIFLDEPFSELDFFTAQKLHQLLLDMWATQQTTVVMVSHYINEAVALAERIVVFSGTPTTIAGIINNDLIRPRNPRTPEFYQKEDEVLQLFGDDTK